VLIALLVEPAWAALAVGTYLLIGAAGLPVFAGFHGGVSNFVELGPGAVLTGMAKRTVDAARTISVSTPEDLDKLLDFVGTAPISTSVAHEGEHLFASERLVVSPAAGVFEPIAGVGDGHRIDVGTVIGHIGDTKVRSAFAGVLQSYIAVSGERVTLRQPIAWLRTV